MKKILLFILIAIATTSSAQNNDYLVSLEGIGALKIGMTQAQLEKLLNKKFTLKNLLDPDSGYLDTIKTKYKNIDVQLYLERRYIDEENYDIALLGVSTSSPLCKTRTGIGIGTDKLKLLTTYDNYSVYMWPDWSDDTYTTRSKTRSVVNVSNDESEGMLVFYLLNKKVVRFEVTYSYGE